MQADDTHTQIFYLSANNVYLYLFSIETYINVDRCWSISLRNKDILILWNWCHGARAEFRAR